VTWQVRQCSTNILFQPIAARVRVSTIFPIHDIVDIFAVQKPPAGSLLILSLSETAASATTDTVTAAAAL